MEKSSFKVGDIILYCKESGVHNHEFNTYITLGKTYKIISINNDGLLKIKDDFNCAIAFMPSRFIKYSDRNKLENEEIMLELVKNKLIGS